MMQSVRQWKDRKIAKLLSRYPSLFKIWEKMAETFEFQDSPWADLKKPVHQCRLVLITSGGFHLKHQEPFDMVNPEGDATFREIPFDSRREDLIITHNYYDHTGADEDINVLFPLERIIDLEKQGDIGAVSPRHFSFMGHIMSEQLDILRDRSIQNLVEKLKEDGAELVLLTPG